MSVGVLRVHIYAELKASDLVWPFMSPAVAKPGHRSTTDLSVSYLDDSGCPAAAASRGKPVYDQILGRADIWPSAGQGGLGGDYGVSDGLTVPPYSWPPCPPRYTKNRDFRAVIPIAFVGTEWHSTRHAAGGSSLLFQSRNLCQSFCGAPAPACGCSSRGHKW